MFEAGVCAVSLQAMIQGELEVLKDWCYEAVCQPRCDSAALLPLNAEIQTAEYRQRR